MLTDLTFLQAGKKWPPPCEVNRLKDYEDNRRIFEDRHGEVYKKQIRRIERVIGNFDDVVSFPIIFNYQKLMSLKIADLIFGEPPKITTEDTAKQKTIDKLLLETELLNTAYAAAIDVSRYGDGILLTSNNKGAVVDVSSPAIWFPVVDPSNIKRVLYNVLAYPYLHDESRKSYRLKVQIHDPTEPSTCEEHLYELSGSVGGWSIGAEVDPITDSKVDTNLSRSPIFRVSNTVTSDRIFGIDDYQSIDSLVSELMVRVSQISRILDVHANPSMAGPDSALEQDSNTGQWRLRVGDYYPRNNSDDPKPEYIVWDASFDANFKQIELLINQLYTISEMGAAIFGDTSGKTGQVTSGTALRRLMMSPLAKARRIANKFDPVLKQIVSLCSEIYGTEIKPEEISIAWNDGLPNDEAEAADIMAIRTGNRPTISQHSAIQRLDGLSEDDANNELEQIREETAASTPPVLGLIDKNGGDPTGSGGEE